MNITDLIIKHEGLELQPYQDSLGVFTIGVGHNLERGISYEAAMFILKEDLAEVEEQAKQFDWFSELNQVRQMVIINMIFNLGITRFKRFKKTIKAIKEKEYKRAAMEMLDSKWSEQVGQRAIELSLMMEAGNV